MPDIAPWQRGNAAIFTAVVIRSGRTRDIKIKAAKQPLSLVLVAESETTSLSLGVAGTRLLF